MRRAVFMVFVLCFIQTQWVLAIDENSHSNENNPVVEKRNPRALLSREEKMRRRALRYVMAKRKHGRVLSRDEKLRRSAMRYMRRIHRHRIAAQAVEGALERPSENPPVAEKPPAAEKTQPQFFFIQHLAADGPSAASRMRMTK